MKTTASIWFLLCCSICSAQHVDIFVYQQDNQLISTGDGIEQRVFSRLFDFFGHPFGNTSLPKAFVGDDPGFQTNDSPTAGASVLPVGSILSGDFLAFQLPDGQQGNVLHWDLASPTVEFQGMPTDHFFEVSDAAGNSGLFLNGETQSLENVPLGLVGSANDIHEHISWRLDDGDGDDDTDPATGVYLMMMQLHMDGVETSEPLAVMLNSTDISFADQTAAVNWVADRLDSITILGDGLTGDFDGNGALELADIDQLVAAVAGQSTDLQFDLDGDGSLDKSDVDTWRAIAGQANLASMNPYLEGDANLDGVVDISDFNIWNGNKFTTVAAWSAGDFNVDGVVDISDFNVWNTNKFQVADGASVVPEPTSGVLGVLFLTFFLGTRRKNFYR
ncbi:MAG: dockerin type I repeat-containing protein [Planctomycetota bacterium]